MKKANVVLTRTENDPHGLGAKYSQIEWLEFPLIQFDYQEIDQTLIQQINEKYDWLIFTSQNGVKAFFEQASDIPNKLIACVGPKTASLVEDFGYDVDFIPSHFTSITLAKEIPVSSSESVCYIGGNLSSKSTIDLLKERSRQFIQVESYHTKAKSHDVQQWQKLLDSKPDIITFASPSAVNSFTSQLQAFEIPYPKQIKYAAIGSTTARAIKDDLGMTAIIGEKHTFASMIEKIVETTANDSKT